LQPRDKIQNGRSDIDEYLRIIVEHVHLIAPALASLPVVALFSVFSAIIKGFQTFEAQRQRRQAIEEMSRTGFIGADIA
jgi:hypothetical protein